MFAASTLFRRRIVLGVISTSSSSLMNSMACSRFEEARGHEPDRLVGGGRAHVGLLLLLRHVDVQVVGAGVLADDHPLVDLGPRADEDLAPLLQVVDRVRGGPAHPVGDERARGAHRDRPVPRFPRREQVVHDPGASGVGEELRPEPDQPARRQVKLQAHAPAAVVDHARHRALPRPDQRDDDALVLLGHVDQEVFDRLEDGAVSLARDDLRPRDLQLEPLAPHHLDEDRQLQLAPADDVHLLGRVGVLDADRHVAEQLARQPVAQVPARSRIARRGRPGARC